MYDVVFVSNTGRIERPYYDPSVRYRAFNPCQYLRSKGFSSVVLSQKAFESNYDSFSKAKIIVFHRPGLTETLARYVLKHRLGQTLVCDYDDLIFDIKATEYTPAVKDRNEDYTQIAKGIAGNAEVGALFDHVTTSTVPLLDAAKKCLGIDNGLVIHNGLTPTYIDIARRSRHIQDTGNKRFQLGYFSGTASHNKDFALIACAMAAFLAQSTSHKLLLVGPLALPSELIPYESQITKLNVVSFYKMTSLIAECEKVLGPLVLDPFAICKSGLKFFEAAPLGVPVLATPIPDIERFTSPLLFKCASAEAWEDALLKPNLLRNQDIQNAAENVCHDASLELQMTSWLNHFGDILN